MGVTAIERYKKLGLVTHLRNSEDLTGLIKMVAMLPVYVGSKPFKNESIDDDIPIVMLANFIQKHYPGFTPEKVVSAFEHAAAGKLYEEGKMVTITSYGKQLNLDLIGGVLRAYKQHLDDMPNPNLTLEERVDKPHLLHSGKEVSMKPCDFLDDLIEKCKEEKALPKFHMFKIVFDHLVDLGELPEAPRSLQRTGGRYSIRQIMASDYQRTKVGMWLAENDHLPKGYNEPIFDFVNDKPITTKDADKL